MNAPSTFTNSGAPVRQKRVLPSRSRRGGPGVGTCDADLMILETQRRKFDNEPLIPGDTPFLLTTNSKVVSTSSSTYAINIHANDRYFERPEVLKAYREQLTIQTPEFISLGDTPAGRLRARSQAGLTEDGPLETSDAAYEKRHRKYETFEKRQRLREKEKLKHEQYKLKERIDQLRAMDPSAFLNLAENLFPAPPGPADAESNDDEGSISGAHINGGPNHIEGERRRKEMLNIAYTLEERYRVLLPPDRMNKKASSQITMDASVEPEVPVHVGREASVMELEDDPNMETERPKLKIKFPGRPPNQSTQTSTSKSVSSKKRRQSAPPTTKQLHTRKTKSMHEPHIQATSPMADDTPSTPHISRSSPPVSPPNTHIPPPKRSARRRASPAATLMSNPEIAVLEPTSPENEVVHREESVSTSSDQPDVSSPFSRPSKRVKLSTTSAPTSSRQTTREPSLPPIESISVHKHRSLSSKQHGTHGAGNTRRKISLLVTSAIRSSGNRTKRHLYAFGGKLQNETFDEIKDFVLPDWATPDSSSEFEPDEVPGARTILTAAEFSKKTPKLRSARKTVL